jgi:hypothetical protein
MLFHLTGYKSTIFMQKVQLYILNEHKIFDTHLIIFLPLNKTIV